MTTVSRPRSASTVASATTTTATATASSMATASSTTASARAGHDVEARLRLDGREHDGHRVAAPLRRDGGEPGQGGEPVEALHLPGRNDGDGHRVEHATASRPSSASTATTADGLSIACALPPLHHGALRAI